MRPSERRLLIAGGVLVALFTLGTLGRKNPWFDLFFGLEAWRELGPLVFFPAAGLFLLLLASPAATDRLAAILSRVAGVVPAVLRAPLVVLAFTAACLLLTNLELSGDAGGILVQAQLGFADIYPSHALTSYLHATLVDLVGLDGREAVRLTSCAAGTVYAVAALGIGRILYPDRSRRASATALLLFAGTAALFFGTLEVYATLAAGTAVYLLLGLRHLAGKSRFPWPALCLGIVFMLHGSAGLLLPSLVWLANGGKVWPLRIGRWLVWGAVFLVPVLMVFGCLYFGTWEGAIPDAGPARTGTFLGAMGQSPILVPTLTPTNVTHRYALLDPEHLVGVLNLYLLAGGASLMLLFAALRRPWGDGRFRFALVVAVFLMSFPIFWNVSYPLAADWDLFSSLGVPLAVLAGIAFLGANPRPGVQLGAALLALFAFAPFVISNATGYGDRLRYADEIVAGMRLAETRSGSEESLSAMRARVRWERRSRDWDDRGYREMLARAAELARTERYGDAAEECKEALRIVPHDPRALMLLGYVLSHLDRPLASHKAYEDSIRAYPNQLEVWVELARTAYRGGDRDRAIRYLERGIRVASLHPLSGDAMRDLARLHRTEGHKEIADELLRVASEWDELRGRKP